MAVYSVGDRKLFSFRSLGDSGRGSYSNETRVLGQLCQQCEALLGAKEPS